MEMDMEDAKFLDKMKEMKLKITNIVVEEVMKAKTKEDVDFITQACFNAIINFLCMSVIGQTDQAVDSLREFILSKFDMVKAANRRMEKENE